MSCRVIGRQAESAFLEALLSHLSELGCKAVVGEYLPTRKNGIVADFLPDHRFEKLENGSYRRDLTAAPPLAASAFPIDIHLQQD
jgi:predicted enzyme involved in methoxymalonyl-ACP biosynthesis